MAGTHLDEQAAVQLRMLADVEVVVPAEDVDAQREAFKAALMRMTDAHLHHFDGAITDTVMSKGARAVPVRRYEPEGAAAGAGLVYFHGGGWVFGDLDTGDRFARALARTLSVAVISVDYRRAPESAYPAAFEDCTLVAELARQEFDVWCAVAGDSAGGNLALATSLAAARGQEYDAQLLLYPCLDAAMSGASYRLYADGYGLTRDAMAYFWTTYGGVGSPTDPFLSPQSAESVEGLPPTVLVSAGFDVLHDENQRLAERLVASGVTLTYLPFMSLPHGFIDLVDRVDAARDAVYRCLMGLRSFAPSVVVTNG